MKADGSIIIDTKINDDGLIKGFEAIKSGMDSIADKAEKTNREIQAAFSGASSGQAGADVQELGQSLDTVTGNAKEAEKALDDMIRKAAESNNSGGSVLTGPIQGPEAMTGYQQYDAAEIAKSAEEYASKMQTAEQHTSELLAALQAAEKEVSDLKAKGFFWDDAEFQAAQQKLARIKEDIKSIKQDTIEGETVANPFGMDTIAGKVREAELEVQRLVAAGKGLGNEDYDRAYTKLARLRSEARAYAQELANASEEGGTCTQIVESGCGQMGAAIQGASGQMEKFISRVNRLASRVFIFSVITAGLRAMRTWLKNVVAADGEAAAAMAQLKGALLTLAQPLAEVVIPLFITLVQILTRVISVMAQIVAMLTGRSITGMKNSAKALNAQAGAIDNVGSAAKEASKYLAGFDELNVMQSPDTGGGGGSGSSTATPSFDFDTSKTTEELKNILGLIELIAAVLLAMKFGNGFMDGLGKAVGFFLIINGLLNGIQSYVDAWKNGIDFENLSSMIGRITEVIVGLYLALGPTAAAIGLIVAGIAMLVLGIKDAMEVGFNAQNLITTITGLLLAGLGISLLVGSWIPLLIAAIAGLLLVIVNFFGDTDQLLGGLKEMLSGFKEFFSGIFSGDIEKSLQGIGKIFSGLRSVVGSVVDALENMLNSFLDWLDKKTGGKLHGIIELVKSIIGNAFQYARDKLTAFLNIFQSIFMGLTKFISGAFTGNWEKAWEGIKDIFKGIWNGIADLFGATINAIIRGLNWLIGKMNRISFTAPSWVPGIGGKTIGINIPTISEWQVPHLAQGAVIPPNREFMAVLGDQKRGTNIEAPLETIQEAVALVMDDMIASNTAGQEAMLAVLREILSAVLGIQIGDDVLAQAVERSQRKMAILRGGRA